MGEIFLAKQRGPSGFEKLLVIKRILSHHLDKKDYLDMFFSEAKLVARLNHHNIIQIHEMGEIDGDYYIAMEYVRGKSMRDLIDELRAEGKMLPLPHVIDLAIKLCEGLGYAHQARDIRGRPMNIVHRDINPHNVLISYTGDLKVIDFGIAKSEMTSVHTATGTIKGKFVYMSPEQSAADPIDRRSDIFSLGIVLYELCCLENPFVRQNVVLSLEAIQRHDVAPPSTKRADAGPVDDILMRALSKKPEERFQTAIEMRDSLRQLFTDGAVRPVEEDMSTFLHKLFSADIEEEDRLLAEADRATQPPPAAPSMQSTIDAPPTTDGDLIDAPSDVAQLPFPDEEETVAGDLEGIAARSRLGTGDVPIPPAVNLHTEHPTTPQPQALASDSYPGYVHPSESLPNVPTRSDRIPKSEPDLEDSGSIPSGNYLAPGHAQAPSGNEFPAPPMRAIDANASMQPQPAPFAEPMPAAGGPLAPTKELIRAEPSTGAVERRMVPVQSPDYVTDEDSMLTSAKPAMPNFARLALYALVLIVTTVAGFLVTRAVIAPSKEKRGVALLPIEDADKNPEKLDPPEKKDPVDEEPVDEPPPIEPDDGQTGLPSSLDVEPPDGEPEDEIEPPKKKRKKKKRKKKRASKKKRRKKKKVDDEPKEKAPPPPPPPVEKKVEKPVEKKRPTRLGTLTVKTNAQVSVEVGGRSAGTSPSAIAVRRESGTIKLGGSELPYTVKLRYTVEEGGVSVKVDASPWAIVKNNGLSLGRTPRDVRPASRHKISLLRPGQDSAFVVSLIWNPKK